MKKQRRRRDLLHLGASAGLGIELATKSAAGPGSMDFVPSFINRFLQAHLFGEMFERDNLGRQSRELATVGALAAMPGAETQLRSPRRASMRDGLSEAQLRRLTQMLAERGDEQADERADAALTQALAATTGC